MFELQFSSPWGHLGVILGAIGSILGVPWAPNPLQNKFRMLSCGLSKTVEKPYVLEGFEAWRHPSWLQNELLETLEDDFGADDVTWETLRGSWMLCWRS